MGQTMTSKILAKASGTEQVAAGDVVLAKLEMFSCSDAGLFVDSITEKNLKVWNSDKLIFCFDHFFQPDWILQKAITEHPKIRKFAKAQGIPKENVYDVGRHGISHHVPVEQGWTLPGTVCIALDTEAPTMGAANCFSVATIYGSEPIVLSGDIWMMVPECVRINFTGQLKPGISGKDVVYGLKTDLGEAVNGKVIEFSGPGLANLTMDTRMAIANGAGSMGALTMIFPYDQVLDDYFSSRARGKYTPAVADADADYSATYEYDLGSFDHLVSGPHEIEIIRPLSEVVGQEIQAAYVGSCVAGRLDDMALAARVLKGRKVHPDVRMVVTPISAETMREATAQGITQILVEAGATVTEAGCGACYLGALSPLKLGDGERLLSTATEPIRGRMGSNDSEILLASPAVVAASAITGRITDPSEYL